MKGIYRYKGAEGGKAQLQLFGSGQPMSQQFRLDGRPISQWSRLASGRSDDLGTAGL